MLPLATVVLALTIFAVDTLSPFGMAVAVLYVVVVLMAARFLERRAVLAVAAACAVASIVSYLIQHGGAAEVPLARLLVSLAAIGIAAFLVLENQAAAAETRKQAGLLELTQDAIFVRDMKNVVTYWNRGAEALYGQPRDEAIGFSAREVGEMPPPGSTAPARLSVRLRDPIWDFAYAPIAELVGYAATRLNVLQFLTIRSYLSLVFAALVLLLLVLAI